MTDELELLRQANPVRQDEAPWRDGPLDSRAERQLNRLLHGSARRGRRRLVMTAVTAAVVAVATLTFTLSGTGTTPALAAPAPLTPRDGSRGVPLGEIARRAKVVADDSHAALRRGSHLQEWALSMEAGPGGAPPVTVPEEHITRWKPDGSGSELVVATDPRHPGRPVIDDSGGTPRRVHDGKVLHRQSYPPGTRLPDALRPPHDPAALRDYLTDLYIPGATTTPELLDAVSSLLREWTPGPRETAALAALLADARGLRPVGAITDRLGRPGQAYVYDGGGTADARYMLILDPDSGRILGIEVTFTKDVGDYQVKAGDVMSYVAWMP